MRKTIITLAALAVTAAVPASASAAGANFVTPGAAAYCATDEDSGDYLVCWTPNDGFTVGMYWAGRSGKRYERANRHYRTHAGRTLRFGQTWRGSNGFTCVSTRNGLTCTNARGHGWWLGRYVGYRMF
jgi:hypothetical protein